MRREAALMFVLPVLAACGTDKVARTYYEFGAEVTAQPPKVSS